MQKLKKNEARPKFTGFYFFKNACSMCTQILVSRNSCVPRNYPWIGYFVGGQMVSTILEMK